MSDTRQRVHEMVDQLPPPQLAAVEGLLKAILDDEELTPADRKAIADAREYFANGGQGIPFEQFVAECGFTMEEIRSSKDK